MKEIEVNADGTPKEGSLIPTDLPIINLGDGRILVFDDPDEYNKYIADSPQV